MPASFPSSSRPVGLQHLFTVHLTSKIQNSDLIYWCTVWFLQTETRRLTERKVFVVALAARPVWGHICLCSSSSSNLQRLCLSGKKKAFQPTQFGSRTKLQRNSECLCFLCSIEVLAYQNLFLPLTCSPLLHRRHFWFRSQKKSCQIWQKCRYFIRICFGSKNRSAPCQKGSNTFHITRIKCFKDYGTSM